MNEMARMMDIDSAVAFPQVYIAARIALAKCDRIDECHDWANKAEALHSYARQAKDETLLVFANRIKARATRRCGELLSSVPTARGAKSEANRAASRTAAAREAGLSAFQQATALQVAAVPTAQFECAVESDSPPTVTTIAAMGRGRRGWHQIVRSPKKLSVFAHFCAKTRPDRLARLVPEERERAIKLVEQIRAWCDEFLKERVE